MDRAMVHVVHSIPGRVHVRAPALANRRELAVRVATRLAADPAFERVSVRERTGSVVVTREEGDLEPELVARRVAEAVATESPRAPPVARAPGETRLAKTIEDAATAINAEVRRALDGHADLGTLMPLAFAAGGLVEIARTGKLPLPSWFNLLWWSLRSFMTFNVDPNFAHGAGASGNGAQQPSPEGEQGPAFANPRPGRTA
jgi:hypothetical protein